MARTACNDGLLELRAAAYDCSMLCLTWANSSLARPDSPHPPKWPAHPLTSKPVGIVLERTMPRARVNKTRAEPSLRRDSPVVFGDGCDGLV